MAPSISIRQAEISDIPGIAIVLIETWRSTFRGVLSAEFLSNLSIERQIESYYKIVLNPQVCCFVAIRNNRRIVGFCCGGPNRSPLMPALAEIYAIYVLDDHHGQGIGEDLFRNVSRRLASTLGSGLIVWVIASNIFRPFYERLGGRETSSEEITLGDEKVLQIAYGISSDTKKVSLYIKFHRTLFEADLATDSARKRYNRRSYCALYEERHFPGSAGRKPAVPHRSHQWAQHGIL